MPCTTLSRARTWDGLGPGLLRTDDEPWGITSLNVADRKNVETGNALFRFTLRLLKLCERHSVPYALENPETSMAWDMKPMRRFILDFCQFGEAWKKPTQIQRFRLVSPCKEVSTAFW